jgi:WD40 repeat protein
MEEFNRRENEFHSRLLKEEITEDLEEVRIGVMPARGVQLRQVLRGHTDRIHGISWSPDGRYLASPSGDKTVRIWEEATGECISTLEENEDVKHCAWSPNGQDLVYGSDKQIKLWNGKDAASSELLAGDFRRLDSLVYSPDGKRLALAYGFNTIQILDTSTWREVGRKVFDPRVNHRINLQWFEDGRQIAANPIAGWIQIRDVQTLELMSKIEIPGERNDIYSFSFLYAKHGNKVAVAEEKKPIKIFDLLSGQMEKQMNDSTSYTSGLAFSPDGTILVSWSHDDSVNIWRTDTGEKLARIHEYSLRVIEPVFPIFHPAKPSLVTFCEKRTSMRIWDLDYNKLLAQ